MIEYRELEYKELDEYGKIPFVYKTTKKYDITKENDEYKFELVDIPLYEKDFGTRIDKWTHLFDLSHWKFFGAFHKGKMIGGLIMAAKTDNCHMLEGRFDLALIWEIRVDPNFKHKGIGQHLFDMARDCAKLSFYQQMKVECQNTNVPAVNFYLKQGFKLAEINDNAYGDYPEEKQLILYLDL